MTKKLGIRLAIIAVLIVGAGVYFSTQRPRAEKLPTVPTATSDSCDKSPRVSFDPVGGESFAVTYEPKDQLFTVTYHTTRPEQFKVTNLGDARSWHYTKQGYTGIAILMGNGTPKDPPVGESDWRRKIGEFYTRDHPEYASMTSLVETKEIEVDDWGPKGQDALNLLGDQGYYQLSSTHKLSQQPGFWQGSSYDYGGQGVGGAQWLKTGTDYFVTFKILNPKLLGKWHDLVALVSLQDSNQTTGIVPDKSANGRYFFYPKAANEDKSLSLPAHGADSAVTLAPQSSQPVTVSESHPYVTFTAKSSVCGKIMASVVSKNSNRHINAYVVEPITPSGDFRMPVGTDQPIKVRVSDETLKQFQPSEVVELQAQLIGDDGGISDASATQPITKSQKLTLSSPSGRVVTGVEGPPEMSLSFNATLTDNDKKPIAGKPLTANVEYASEWGNNVKAIALVQSLTSTTDDRGELKFSVVSRAPNELKEVINAYRQKFVDTSLEDFHKMVGNLVVKVSDNEGDSQAIQLTPIMPATVNDPNITGIDMRGIDNLYKKLVASTANSSTPTSAANTTQSTPQSTQARPATTTPPTSQPTPSTTPQTSPTPQNSEAATQSSKSTTATPTHTKEKVELAKVKAKSGDKVFTRKDAEDAPTAASFTTTDKITLEGVGTPGTTLTLTVYSEPQTSTVLVKDDGTWSYTMPALPAGDHHVDVSASGASDSVTLFNFSVSAATTAPAPTATTAPASDSQTTTVTPTLNQSATNTGSTTPSTSSSLTAISSNATSSSTGTSVKAGETVLVTVKDAKEGQTLDVKVGDKKVASVQAGATDVKIPVKIPAKMAEGATDVTISSPDWNADLKFPVDVAATHAARTASPSRTVLVLLVALLGVFGLWLWLLRRRRSSASVRPPSPDLPA